MSEKPPSTAIEVDVPLGENAGLIRGYIDTTATAGPRDIGSVYGGGELVNIPIDDLVENRTAIQQLINNHNQQARDCDAARRRLGERESEVEFLKASPFVAIFAAIVSCAGSAVLCAGINMLTGSSAGALAWVLTIAGSLLIIGAALANILYPFARSFFNRDRSQSGFMPAVTARTAR